MRCGRAPPTESNSFREYRGRRPDTRAAQNDARPLPLRGAVRRLFTGERDANSATVPLYGQLTSGINWPKYPKRPSVTHGVFCFLQLAYRKSLIKSLRFLASKLHLDDATVHLAVYLLDMFMDCHDIRPSDLMLASSACLLISGTHGFQVV